MRDNFVGCNVVGVHLKHKFSGWVVQQESIKGLGIMLTVEADQPFRVFGEPRRFVFVSPADLLEIACQFGNSSI